MTKQHELSRDQSMRDHQLENQVFASLLLTQASARSNWDEAERAALGPVMQWWQASSFVTTTA